MRGALPTGLLALALGVCAAIFDAEPLWVPAVLLGVLVAGCSAWVALVAHGVRVHRTLGARRVLEDEPVSAVVEVRAGRLPLLAGTVTDPLLPAAAPLPGGRRRARLRIEARFARRGRRVLAPTTLEVGDPLGLARRRVTARAALAAPAGDEILVVPRLEPIVAPAAGGTTDPVARCARPPAGAEIDLDGVRPLREGAPAARIFWPSIARNAEPQERRLAADGDTRPVVVLDPRGAERDEDLDAAVRAAASLAHHLARAGGCGVLLPGDRRAGLIGPTLAGWAHVHARLAVVPAGGRPLLGALANRRGAVIFVSARPRTRLPAALGRSGVGTGPTRILVVPIALGDRAEAFTVAGCHGYELRAARAQQRAARRAAGAAS